METVTLNNGHNMPNIGLGLYLMSDRIECIQAVNAALEAGYRLFDTAQAYHNEEFLGDGLMASDIPREEVFITTKIAVDNFAPHLLVPSFKQSLDNLQADMVDLLLLHFPVTDLRQEAWRALEKIYHSGRAAAIGVSNYTVRHLEELLETADVTPAVNQVELHVYLQQPELLAYCQSHDIAVEAYSPLAHAHGLDQSVLESVARKYGKTPAQIMIRWCLEVGAIPLPKSVNPRRIRENIDVFDFSLDAADMSDLAALDRELHTSWDPTQVA